MSRPHVAIVIPVMDRAAELRRSLPLIVRQDYPEFSIWLVDLGSRDDVEGVVRGLADDRIFVLRCPRPEYFSFACARNIGARYSGGDLLLFLNGDNVMAASDTLASIVRDFEAAERIERRWWANWRAECGYEPLALAPAPLPSSFGAAYGHADGSVLLVERRAFESIGGYNEALEDWGYEDTDLVGRFELGGFGRVPIRGIGVLTQDVERELRVANFRQRDTALTWARNRFMSDLMIKEHGPAFATTATPGRCEDIRMIHAGTESAGEERDWPIERVVAPDSLTRIYGLGALFIDSDPAEYACLGRLPRLTVAVLGDGGDQNLEASIESVLQQRYPHLDCRAIGDPHGLHAGLADERLIWGAPAADPSASVNVAWQESAGELLAWLHAGDLWRPCAAGRVVATFVASSDVDVVYGHCDVVDGRGGQVSFLHARQWSLAAALKESNPIIHQPATFYRRGAVEAAGWLGSGPLRGHDLLLRLAASSATFAMLPIHLASQAGRNREGGSGVTEARVHMTRRFFEQPGLLAETLRLRRGAISSAHLRGIYDLSLGRPKDWLRAVRLVVLGTAVDPLNAAAAAWRIGTRLLASALPLPRRQDARQPPDQRGL